jgi:hypothetical protein
MRERSPVSGHGQVPACPPPSCPHLPIYPGSQAPGLTLRSGGHSCSPWASRFSSGSASVRNTCTVLSLYSSRKQTPEASQNRTVPSSCLWAEPAYLW